jgi:hypothetical protein
LNSWTGKVYLYFGRESKSWLIDPDYSNNTARADTISSCPSTTVPPQKANPSLFMNVPSVAEPIVEPDRAVVPETAVDVRDGVSDLVSGTPQESAKAAQELAGHVVSGLSGEIFYVNPLTLDKVDISTPNKVFDLMKAGLGATHAFIANTVSFPVRLLGRILLDVESRGEAYYIDPVSRGKRYLGRPNEAFEIFEGLVK